MGTDVYEIFDKCVKKSVEIHDHDNFYNFDKFLTALSDHGDKYRTAAMCRLIADAMSDDDDFMQFIAEMISGDDEYQVTIIKHGFGKFEMSGDLPENAELIIKVPMAKTIR